MSMSPTSFPLPYEFLSSFGVEPIEAAPEDGFWAYEFAGPTRSRVRFSFNIHEGSVQTTCFMGDEIIALSVSEGALSISIEQEARIHITFEDCMRKTLTIFVLPTVHLEWIALQ